MTAPVEIRAERLARSGKSWLRVRSKLTNRPVALGVPSQSRPGLFHLATTRRCDCKGFEHYGECVHILAVRAYCAQVKSQKGAA